MRATLLVRTLVVTMLVLGLGSMDLGSMALAQSADLDGDGLTDAFEERYGLTDPELADSDGDGLVDSAEDLDGDGLGNLGEQRFGTDPGDPDSDGDGVDDGDEDADGNGVPNAREQDRRPLPADVHPEPALAWWDRPPNYDDACHNDEYDPDLHPCSYGMADGSRTVVLFGDSHALQWQPGLKAAALANGWRLVVLTKAACPPPPVTSARKDAETGASCEAWRPRALQWIAQEQPDVVLMTGGGRIYRLEDEAGKRISGDERTATWTAALATTLEAMPDATAAVVMADTPYLETNPAICLEKAPGDLLACSTPRSSAIDTAFDAAEREATEAAGAVYADLGEVICPYSPCPIVFGDVFGWRNRDHITATFSETLAPTLVRVVDEALAASERAVATAE